MKSEAQKTSKKEGKSTMEELDRKIYTLLKRIGVPASLDGHAYISTALHILLDKGYHRIPITGPDGLYARIAKQHNTTPGRVERSIRHAAEAVFLRISPELSEQIFGASIDPHKGKLPNGDFLHQLALEIKYAQ